MIRIGLVSNPQSLRNRQGLARVETLVSGRPELVHRRLEPGADPATLLADLVREDLGVLAINGGDGTVQRLLTVLLSDAAFEPLPPLAILAGGTTNLVADDVGFGGPPARGLARLLDVADDGLERCIRRRHVMRVANLAGCGPQYGMFLGTGAIARAVGDHAVRRAGSGGMARALSLPLALMRLGADGLSPRHRRRILHGAPIRMRIDGDTVREGRRLLVLVTTLARLAFGTTPFWNQGEAPLRFTSVSDRPPRLLLSTLRVLAGGDGSRLPAGHYESGGARRIDLGLSEPLALDGEIFAPAPDRAVAVTAPRALDFVTGRP